MAKPNMNAEPGLANQPVTIACWFAAIARKVR
jgi:hypothetical protein